MFRVKVSGLGFRVQGLGFRVQGLGFREDSQQICVLVIWMVISCCINCAYRGSAGLFGI